MKRRLIAWPVLGLSSAALLLAGCGGSDGDSTPATPAKTYQATLRYTSHGVPHITAKDFKGAGYAYGYAFAQDNVCLFAEEVATLRGERSKHFGEAGKYLGQLGDTWNNVESDFFYKLLFNDALVTNIKAGSSQDAQDLTAGFAAGYNRWLRDNATKLPAECAGKEWVGQITERDVYWRYMQAAMAGSSMALINSIGAAQPPGAAAPTAVETRDVLKRLDAIRKDTIGSNGYGLGRDVTESGKGIVMGNPHFPWWGSLRLNMLHMNVTSKNYNVYGATLLGVPLPLIGFNDKVAWTHTFSTDNRFTLRVLNLDPTNPTRYIKDGASVAMTPVPLKITAKAADGTLKEIARTLYRSEFGPMLVAPSSGLVWSNSLGFAIQDANYGNYKLIDQVILNGQASDVASLRTAQATYSAMPWVNIMAADAKGDVLYGNFSVAANVLDAQIAPNACVPGASLGAPFFDMMNTTGMVVMTGSTKACDWSGWIDGSRRPWVIRSDYIVNANDSHWWPSRNTFLAGYPKIIATGPDAEGVVQGERTRTGHAIVRDRLAGTDGVAGNRFTVAKLQELYLQGRFYRAEKWVPGFAAACQASATASAAAKDACAVLAGWNMKHGMGSSGAVLFREFYEKLGELEAAKWWATPYDKNDPLDTPRGTATASVGDALAILETLVADPQFNTALKRRARPSDVQILLRGGAPLAIPGGRHTFNNWRGQKTLDPFGSGNYIYTADPTTNAGAYGNSYIQFVTWDDAGPAAEGILTYGQSAHPSSPFWSDQTKLYSAGKWAKLPYTEAQITADLKGSAIDLSE